MKTFLIIGASSGIGKASAEKLSSAGHQVFGTYHKHPFDSTQLIQSIELDVRSKEISLELPIDKLDGLVFCPGSISLRPFGRIKPEDFVQDFELQVLGAVKIIQWALPLLKKSEQASVVLFSTVAVQMGLGFHSQVAVSKGAIEGLCRSLAAEFAPQIRVNAIAPSLTDTPLAHSLLSTDEKREANAQRHPLKKIGKATDIAALVEFLLLPESSGWMTGQILHVDGGMSSIKS